MYAAMQSRGRPLERGRSHDQTRLSALGDTRSSSPSPSNSSPRTPASRSRSHSHSRPATPPPALTLCDQVHNAYAADDFHLAKVLLLRLQGIEVTSDNDPRIAAVKDEDFDVCFLPYGAPDDGRGKPSQNYSSESKLAAAAEARRAAQLKEKELLWENESRRHRDERARWTAMKRRQAAAEVMEEQEQLRLRLVKERQAAAAVLDMGRRRTRPVARALSYAVDRPSVPAPPVRFTYDFPFTPRNNVPTRVRPAVEARPAAPKVEPLPRDEAPEYRSPIRVTFQQVLNSMQGDLFPVLSSERILTRSSEPRRERMLIDILLDRSGYLLAGIDKGKQRAEPMTCSSCESLPSPPPSSPSTSSSGLSRAGSWLSFAGSSRRSSNASVTTATSSWRTSSTLLDSPSLSKSPQPSSYIRRQLSARNWISAGPRAASPSPVRPGGGCTCRWRNSTRVFASTHPLRMPEPPPAVTAAMASVIPSLFSSIASLARTVQTSYVRAVVVGYDVSAEWIEEEEAIWAERPTVFKDPPAVQRAPCVLPLRPAGSRVESSDLRRFLAREPKPDAVQIVPLAHLSRLTSSRGEEFTRSHRRTELPAPFPHPVVFRTPQPLPKSPWLTVPNFVDHQEELPARPRAVPNSAFLRVKALHNDALVQGSVPPVPKIRLPREAVLGVGSHPLPEGRVANGSALRFVLDVID
ncbi:unnamed protein product [Mycena citricolor]|uniref:Uncharacterized protein n=1 Tax=Mycena citricolor TaxID=2018698 RepID=A0AAD2Q480_9AGAR|nr:unnamed protein product [Mycena citricolor]